MIVLGGWSIVTLVVGVLAFIGAMWAAWREFYKWCAATCFLAQTRQSVQGNHQPEAACFARTAHPLAMLNAGTGRPRILPGSLQPSCMLSWNRWALWSVLLAKGLRLCMLFFLGVVLVVVDEWKWLSAALRAAAGAHRTRTSWRGSLETGGCIARWGWACTDGRCTRGSWKTLARGSTTLSRSPHCSGAAA